jgi:hypothetical protein
MTSEDVISATHLSTFLLCSICVIVTAQILAVDSSGTEMIFGGKGKRRLLSNLKNLLLGDLAFFGIFFCDCFVV